jgi:nicotinamidase-related amidase
MPPKLNSLMPTDQPLPEAVRSPELMSAGDTALLVVDAQEKLLNVVPGRKQIEWNIRRLLDAAATLGVPAAATEQYPEKLGHFPAALAERLHEPISKLVFSGAACCPFFEAWRADLRHHILICGIETHVCIAQTAFDLTAAGWMVYVAVDAVGTRHAIDHETALRRMESAGIILTTTEAAIFEWCQAAGTPEFKKISALAKETPP